MSRYYVEYNIRAGEHSVHRSKVVEASSFEQVIASMPNKETFTLPEYYESEVDGPFRGTPCHVCHTYYEWAEPVKDFMWNWSDRSVVEWYMNNLTPGRVKYIEHYEPSADKRALQRFKKHMSLVYELAMRTIILFVLTLVDRRK